MFVHFLRYVLCRLPRKAQSFASAAIRAIFRQPDLKTAKEAAGKAIALLEPKYPDAATVVRDLPRRVLVHRGAGLGWSGRLEWPQVPGAVRGLRALAVGRDVAVGD